MALPKKLKFFQLSVEGRGYLSEVPELELPTLARNMVDYRAGGMDSPIKSDMGGEPMTMNWTTGGLVPEVYGQFGAQTHDALGLRFSGAYQSADDANPMSVEIVMRGRHSMIEPGTAKAGEDTNVKHTTEVSYYKLTVDGKVWIEIDIMNMVYIVDDVDLYEDYRNAIGI